MAAAAEEDGAADGSDEQLQKARAAAEAQQALFESMVAPPLVARPMALAAWAKEEAHVIGAKAVAALSESELGAVQLCRVRGDGHCLFRAIGELASAHGGTVQVLEHTSQAEQQPGADGAAEPGAGGEPGAAAGFRRCAALNWSIICSTPKKRLIDVRVPTWSSYPLVRTQFGRSTTCAASICAPQPRSAAAPSSAGARRTLTARGTMWRQGIGGCARRWARSRV